MSLTCVRLVHQNYEVFKERDLSDVIRVTSQGFNAMHIIRSLLSSCLQCSFSLLSFPFHASL